MSIDKSIARERLGEIILERSFKYSDNPPFTLASGRQSKKKSEKRLYIQVYPSLKLALSGYPL